MATTTDAFNAIADERRREILLVLADGERPVNEMVMSLGWPQPTVSKHLAVLKEVGLVSVRDEGRQRFYRINGDALKPVYDWAKTFEKFWDRQLQSIKERAERKAREQARQEKTP